MKDVKNVLLSNVLARKFGTYKTTVDETEPYRDITPRLPVVCQLFTYFHSKQSLKKYHLFKL